MNTRPIITSEDGTRFEVLEDGTLRALAPDKRSNAANAANACGPTADRPMAWSELRNRARAIEADADVPDEFRNMWTDLSVAQRASIVPVERERGDDTHDHVAGHRPPWVGECFKPRAAVRPARPRLMHRGVDVHPLHVFGADDRRLYNDTRYPWVCVCRINTPSTSGSGVLVGPRHVLTASHVIDWSSGGVASVLVHRAGATVQATGRAVRTWAFDRVTTAEASTVDEDYAVIVTDQRLGDRFGWLGTRTYTSSWDDDSYWWNIGYTGAVGGGAFPLFQRSISLDEDELDYGPARAMTTSGDVTPGQSGSPVFGFWSDGPYVVAVVSAESRGLLSGRDNWCAGGTLLTRLVRHARAHDP